ncbi:hydrolase [Roseibium aquae]|uniref:Hydrolase n=1 Tax=Roseibium aquae TaxID=1323746 RepID=A0A916TMR1_9HYPH|nr:alpha/beta fold hydrolase [Roseibium aquae]GGB61908.1 hydrolase [Roseibium aquae]
MTPLVLLPGMMCDARLFGPQIAAFSGTRTLHCAPITGQASIEALAISVLEHAPPRFALAGLSMGGIVAMEVIRKAPDRVAGLALLDTNPCPELETVKAKREPQIEKVLSGHLRSVVRNELKPNYLASGPRRREILDLCMTMAVDLGPEVFVRQSRALQTRPDQRASLQAVKVPTLILMGADDRLCPIERHELMHKLIDGSRLVIIEGAGHLPTLERPEEVSAALTHWLGMIDR